MAPALPGFVPSMLARRCEPFDSEDYLFEIKWDGMRAQAGVHGGGYTLMNRHERDLITRYPELESLRQLPDGTYLDGEIIVIEDGKPRFDLVMQRESTKNAHRVQALRNSMPVTFVVFDLLYERGTSIMSQPLAERRARLTELLDGDAAPPYVVLSSGVVGTGLEYFEAAVAQELEGVMAKRLESRYQTGRRTDDWLKIKRTQHIQCAVVGFTRTGKDLRSLIIAAQIDGELRCVGKVGSGLSTAVREDLEVRLAARQRDSPWMDCEIEGLWVEPGLYCNVSYLELTRAGHLRAPVFLDLIEDQ